MIRVFGGNEETSLRTLPGREATPEGATDICPEGAPLKTFDVAAVEVPLPLLEGETGKVYVLAEDKAALLAGDRAPEPLVLRINAGDCLIVHFSNETASAASFHATLLAGLPGIAAGRNPMLAVPAGETKTYTYFAHPDLGEGTALVYDANVLEHVRLGLYGAVIVGASGTRYTDPVSGEDMSLKASWRADAHPPAGPGYRSFALFIQDEDEIIGTAVMPYTESVEGVLGLNYRLEPFAPRLARSGDSAAVFRSDLHGDPVTPLLEAYPGDAIRLHLLAPYSEQAHVFSVEGHRWPLEPGRDGSTLLSSVQLGAMEAITLELQAGEPGDYLYGDHREAYREAGLWGLLRVHERSAELKPLPPKDGE